MIKVQVIMLTDKRDCVRQKSGLKRVLVWTLILQKATGKGGREGCTRSCDQWQVMSWELNGKPVLESNPWPAVPSTPAQRQPWDVGLCQGQSQPLHCFIFGLFSTKLKITRSQLQMKSKDIFCFFTKRNKAFSDHENNCNLWSLLFFSALCSYIRGLFNFFFISKAPHSPRKKISWLSKDSNGYQLTQSYLSFFSPSR